MEEYKVFGGIDNGVTGTIAVITPTKKLFLKMPVYKSRSYTKEVKYITRIDYTKLCALLEEISKEGKCLFYLERPMINPKRWVASLSAIRALEATLLALEQYDIEYEFIDSRKWQHYMFPDIRGTNFLKQASMMRGLELFPEYAKIIKKHKDADALMIVQYLLESKGSDGRKLKKQDGKKKEKKDNKMLEL